MCKKKNFTNLLLEKDFSALAIDVSALAHFFEIYTQKVKILV
jgi:hypothetical protein